jgi:hypothetical protein
VLEHLAAKVLRKLRVVGQVLPDDGKRGIAGLAAEERAEPSFEVEDPAVPLDEGEGIECGAEVRQGERLVLEGVEGAEAAGGPVLVEGGVGEPAGEVVLLDARARPRGAGDEGAAAAVGRGVALGLLGEPALGGGGAASSRSRPAISQRVGSRRGSPAAESASKSESSFATPSIARPTNASRYAFLIPYGREVSAEAVQSTRSTSGWSESRAAGSR